MGRFFNLIVVLLLIAGVAFVTAPWFAFRALKADARDGDVQGLVELIDYEALRADLRPQLTPRAQPAGPAPSIWSDPMGAIRHAIEPLTPPPPAVDLYISVGGLHALTRGYEPGHAPAEPPPPTTFKGQVAALIQPGWPRLRYWGPNRVRFAVQAPDNPAAEVLFIFQRKAPFAWKLVGIRLPGGPPAA